MTCTIVWNSLNFSEWESKFKRLSRSTLTQCCDYALAVCPLYGQRPRWGLIFIDGKEAGMCQIQEAGILGNLFHAVILDRGPLWFDGFGGEEHFELFLREFSRFFPKRIARKHRIIAEIQESDHVGHMLTHLGFKKHGLEPYKTVWLDLRLSLEELRAGLKKKWRNALSKAERSGLVIEWDEGDENLEYALRKYEEDRQEKNYPGPDPKIVRALASQFVSKKNLLIGHGCLDGEKIAGILILCHGTSATYQIGWTSSQGRSVNAHHLMLWQVLDILRHKGITDFDLGGIHEEYAKGVQTFKTGMGGEVTELPGIYT